MIFIFVFFPILSRVIPFHVSEESMKNHLINYYPNCLNLSKYPGFFVFVNTCQSKKGVFVVLVSLFGGATLYLIVCAILIYEIKMQSYAWNVNKTKNHIKVLKHTIVQVKSQQGRTVWEIMVFFRKKTVWEIMVSFRTFFVFYSWRSLQPLYYEIRSYHPNQIQ